MSSLISTEILLNNGLAKLGLNLPKTTQRKIDEYILYLQKWNKTYNLTAINDQQEIIIKHIFDSLAILPYVIGPQILDVGSGAGLPGIPLALTLPDQQFTLLDSNNKKTRFLRYVITTLELTNVSVVTSRIEQFTPTNCFNTIVSRATSSSCDILQKTRHLYCNDGQLLMMKGKLPSDEINELKCYQAKNANTTALHFEVHKLFVPYLEADRHLLVIREITGE